MSSVLCSVTPASFISRLMLGGASLTGSLQKPSGTDREETKEDEGLCQAAPR